MSKDAEGDSELQRELARGYQRLATVQGDATVSNTGQISAAEASTRKAMNLFEAVAKENPTNTDDQLNLAKVHRQKGVSDSFYPDGRPDIEQAIAITDRLIGTDGGNPKVQLERAIELEGRGMCFDISGERSSSIESLQRSLALVDAMEQHDPNYSNMRGRKAKLLVQLGTEFSYAGDLDKARQTTSAGVDTFQEIVNHGAPPDTVRDLAQSRLRLGRIELMSNDVPSVKQNFQQARALIEPLAKGDRDNILFHTDVLSIDFAQGRLLVLEGKFKEAEPQLKRVIDDFAKLGSEEDVGPGDGLMFTWLGEAQFGMKDYGHALQSFEKAIAALENDVQYEDGRTGLITDYVRLGDTQLKLGHLPEAEAAYNKARSNADADAATARNDVPAIYAAAEVEQGLGKFWMMQSSSGSKSEGAEAAREKGCNAINASFKTRARLTHMRISPSDYPIIDADESANLSKRCVAVQLGAQ